MEIMSTTTQTTQLTPQTTPNFSVNYPLTPQTTQQTPLTAPTTTCPVCGKVLKKTSLASHLIRSHSVYRRQPKTQNNVIMTVQQPQIQTNVVQQPQPTPQKEDKPEKLEIVETKPKRREKKKEEKPKAVQKEAKTVQNNTVEQKKEGTNWGLVTVVAILVIGFLLYLWWRGKRQSGYYGYGGYYQQSPY